MKIVIIGAGPAGVSTVETIRAYNRQAEIVMLSAEPTLPYSPPAMADHFITGSGLGGIIDASRTQQRVDKVFAVLLLASGLGIALFGIVNAISWLTLRHWHASEKSE